MKILLLEDDVILNDIIYEYLESLGYEVESFFSGFEALEAIKKRGYDLLLLDVGVPEIDGFELLEYLREIEIKTPAIFITSLNSVSDLEKGFKVGCDDYIKKPFDLKELEVRIENIKRTHSLDASKKIVLRDKYEYDFFQKCIFEDKKSIKLAQKEADILEYFLKNKNRVISLDELISNIWSFDDSPSYATIRTYIKKLRKVLPPNSILTLKGIGYKYEG